MRSRRTSGVISIYVLILCLFYTTVALTLLAYHLGAFNDSMNIQDQAQARLLAQTAAQEGRYFLMHTNPAWSGTSPEFSVSVGGTNVGSYLYRVVNTCKMFQIMGNGYVPNATALRKVSSAFSLVVRDPNPWTVFADGFEGGNLSQWTTSGDCASTSVAGSAASWDVLSDGQAKKGAWAAKATRTGASASVLFARMCTPVFDLTGCDQVVLRFVFRGSGVVPDSILLFQDSGLGFGGAPVASVTPTNLSYHRPAERVTVTSGLTATTRFRIDVGMGASTKALYLDDFQVVVPLSPYDATVD